MMMCPRPHPLLLRGRPPRHACSGQVGLVGSTAGDDGGSAGGGGRDALVVVVGTALVVPAGAPVGAALVVVVGTALVMVVAG